MKTVNQAEHSEENTTLADSNLNLKLWWALNVELLFILWLEDIPH